MGEMDTSALETILHQLKPSGRNALRHLLANAAAPLSLAVELANDARDDADAQCAAVEVYATSRDCAAKLRHILAGIDRHADRPLRGSADEECEVWR